MASRKILLTGVSSGLGEALLKGFIEEGHTVWGCARSAGQIATLKSQFGAPHHFSVVDVSDDAAVSNWASELLAEHGTPDLLINNAAIYSNCLAEKASLSEY